MASGKPMDRLICGDVGFGKTEVALRAAFIAAMAGAQVAVVVPTTLLARQHYRSFTERFAGLPVARRAAVAPGPGQGGGRGQEGLAEGKRRHRRSAPMRCSPRSRVRRSRPPDRRRGAAFRRRAEGAAEAAKADVHVLTLTATPIPRTLQLALSGVREMSIIATPPVDRLAVRTFVMPYDPVSCARRSARARPRRADLLRRAAHRRSRRGRERLREIVPEGQIAVAHGRMAPTELEDVMTAFDDARFDLLLSTNIIETGLDIPAANTMIIHRADMFGLAQLYQLRGRIGRGKMRAYAYLTLPPKRGCSAAAQRRLEVMQTLDTLGAGFTLASHDLDIRGAGNLLGDEQSGHIREVGIELYQHMLEEAVAAARTARAGAAAEEEWTPQITIGTPVLIPENYVPDLAVRLGLYRRIGELVDRARSTPSPPS